jgi:hypothetical protein
LTPIFVGTPGFDASPPLTGTLGHCPQKVR